ncbi:MAG: hypothetical protein OEZ58_03635 [Gammaproteobacteria bacterium]|nr:hypothetical protein [Gammaproteobacteria bacterium]
MATITIGFPQDFEKQSTLLIQDDGIDSHEQIWVWDHFYSLVLHELAKSPHADKLMQTLQAWAVHFADHLSSGGDLLENSQQLLLDPELNLVKDHAQTVEHYIIEVEQVPGTWPAINVRLSGNAQQKRMAYAVIALAQHFSMQPGSFLQELPVHIFAMNQFYEAKMSYHLQDSVSQAPNYALNQAMAFFRDLSQQSQAKTIVH